MRPSLVYCLIQFSQIKIWLTIKWIALHRQSCLIWDHPTAQSLGSHPLCVVNELCWKAQTQYCLSEYLKLYYRAAVTEPLQGNRFTTPGTAPQTRWAENEMYARLDGCQDLGLYCCHTPLALCVCVCVWERETVCVSVCVCVWQRETGHTLLLQHSTLHHSWHEPSPTISCFSYLLTSILTH